MSLSKGDAVNIVAIHNLPPKKEALTKPLAQALGKTLYEATARLRGPGTGPLVVATFMDAGAAETAAARLKDAGFASLVVSSEDLRREGERFAVRRFDFADDVLRLESSQAQGLALPYGDIELILRGISSTVHSEKESFKEKKLDMGMAIATGGLKFSKTEKKTREVITEEREGFIHLYAGGHPVLLLRESALSYDSLGPARQPTRAANFSRVEAELRKRCPAAVYDNRLLNRMEQVQLLGSSLDPQSHMHIATAVLAKSLRPPRP